jgi:hypothetical protein
MGCIQDPEGTKSKSIGTADSHGFAQLAIGNVRTVVCLQDDTSCVVNVGETGRNSDVVIDKGDIAYGR